MKRTWSIFTVALALVVISGCDTSDREQTGLLNMQITDAPFPIDLIEEASITITRVEVRNKSINLGRPFLTLLEDTLYYNLLDLRNGITAELLEREIPAGEYDLIRVYVNNAGITVKDHGSFDVKVPSGIQTGIKIFMDPPISVAGGLTSEVLLDFNVDKSFILKGKMEDPAGIRGFNFKPVIRAVNKTTSGTVLGLVKNAADSTLLANAEVWISADTVITTAYSSEEGFFALPGIPEGTYTLSSVKEGFDTLTVENVPVIAGNRTEQDLFLEAAAVNP